jgi:hypothetical protein
MWKNYTGRYHNATYILDCISDVMVTMVALSVVDGGLACKGWLARNRVYVYYWSDMFIRRRLF